MYGTGLKDVEKVLLERINGRRALERGCVEGGMERGRVWGVVGGCGGVWGGVGNVGECGGVWGVWRDVGV